VTFVNTDAVVDAVREFLESVLRPPPPLILP
jgi:hypothetical protein